MVNSIFGDFINDFVTIWIIIDPIGALPIFIALTAGFDAATRHRMALLSTAVSFVVLIFFISVGQIILTALGVSLTAFEIAGGIILFLFAVQMVLGESRRRQTMAIPNASLRCSSPSIRWPSPTSPDPAPCSRSSCAPTTPR